MSFHCVKDSFKASKIVNFLNFMKGFYWICPKFLAVSTAPQIGLAFGLRALPGKNSRRRNGVFGNVEKNPAIPKEQVSNRQSYSNYIVIILEMI